MRSRSPDENSQCSFDSALNHSREEEDQLRQMPKMPPALDLDLDGGDKILSYSEYSIRNRLSAGGSTQLVADLPNPHPHPHSRLEGELASIPVTVIAAGPGGGSGHSDGGSSIVGIGGGATTTTTMVMAGGGESNTELRKAAAALTINRHSNESGTGYDL